MGKQYTENTAETMKEKTSIKNKGYREIERPAKQIAQCRAIRSWQKDSQRNIF